MDNSQFAQVTTLLPTREERGGGSSTSRWAIIYCPKQGVHRSQKRWERIKELLDQYGVAYDFVQSEGADSVERLAKMLCQNGYETLIIVGGDSALNRALNGMLSLGDEVRRRVAIGLIPNGRGNDFATYWGFSEDDDEATLRALIAHRLRAVDVGYLRYAESPAPSPTPSPLGSIPGGSSAELPLQQRFFLNCVNIGLAANIMRLRYKTRRVLGLATLSYFASMVLLLFQRMEQHVRLRVNEDTIDQRVMNVCVGNCRGYGQTPSAVPYNGSLDVSIVSQPAVLQLMEGIRLLFTGQFLNHEKVRPYRTTRRIRFEDISNSAVSVDGLVLDSAHAPLEIGLLPEHIQFIIP
ncbi:MAG: lipid kinase [Bacteroidaceae bacterium]|nr:lipid kinase [Bacteroidaceae bacterium]MBR1755689.1 lipid kinase [Bacteroidaceae bacterium]